MDRLIYGSLVHIYGDFHLLTESRMNLIRLTLRSNHSTTTPMCSLDTFIVGALLAFVRKALQVRHSDKEIEALSQSDQCARFSLLLSLESWMDPLLSYVAFNQYTITKDICMIILFFLQSLSRMMKTTNKADEVWRTTSHEVSVRLIRQNFVNSLFQELDRLTKRFTLNIQETSDHSLLLIVLQLWQAMFSLPTWHLYLWVEKRLLSKDSLPLLNTFISLSPYAPTYVMSPLANEHEVKAIMTQEPLNGLVHAICKRRVNEQLLQITSNINTPPKAQHTIKSQGVDSDRVSLIADVLQQTSIVGHLRKNIDAAAPQLNAHVEQLKKKLEDYRAEQSRKSGGRRLFSRFRRRTTHK